MLSLSSLLLLTITTLTALLVLYTRNVAAKRVPGSAASACSGNLLEIQILGLALDLLNQKLLWVWLSYLF